MECEDCAPDSTGGDSTGNPEEEEPVCCTTDSMDCPDGHVVYHLTCGFDSTGCDAASEEDFKQKCDNYMVMAGDFHMDRSTCGQTHCNGARASNSAPATAAARRADAGSSAPGSERRGGPVRRVRLM